MLYPRGNKFDKNVSGVDLAFYLISVKFNSVRKIPFWGGEAENIDRLVERVSEI